MLQSLQDAQAKLEKERKYHLDQDELRMQKLDIDEKIKKNESLLAQLTEKQKSESELINELNGKLSKLNSDNDGLKKTHDETTQLLAESQKTIESQKKTISESDDKIKDLTDKNLSLNSEVSSLNVQLDNANKLIIELRGN